MNNNIKPDAILIFSGHDPSGGAGVVADVQTTTAYGFHPVVVVTAVTAQSLDSVKAVEGISATLIGQQALTALKDWNIRVVKIGLVPDLPALRTIANLIREHNLPNVIVDPVRIASNGDSLTSIQDPDLWRKLLLSMKPVLTPNKQELQTLSPQGNARTLIRSGARAVLVTDGEGSDAHCEHHLFTTNHSVQSYRHARLKGSFHGSGCTLSSALASEMVRGHTIAEAVALALNYTFESLSYADPRGGVTIPKRYRKRATFHSVSGLYVVTPDVPVIDDQYLHNIDLALTGGARILQLRNKSLDDDAFVAVGLKVRALCRRHGARLIVNDRLHLVKAIEADGVYLGEHDEQVLAARALLGPSAIIGATCYNSLDRAVHVQQQGADYVAFGAVYPSPTKPAAPCVSLQVLRGAVDSLRIPVVAIGGINADNARQLKALGVDALAVVSACLTETIFAAQRLKFLNSLTRATDHLEIQLEH